MPSFEEFLGGGGEAAKQLFIWSVLSEIVRAAADPYFRALTYLVNTHDPNIPLSPPDLAQAVVRHVMEKDQAAKTARLSGTSTTEFETMLHLAAEPPGLETVLQMYRRGIVEWGEAGPTKANVANAIATSRIYTYWSDAIRKLNIVPIPAAEMVDAAVERQTTKTDRTTVLGAISSGTTKSLNAAATTFYTAMYASGYTPTQADLMFNTRGNPPAPTQLLDLYRRGAIKWTGVGTKETTVQQGIYEGATKDKWEPIYKDLVVRIPSEYYVLEMLKLGAMSQEKGAALLGMYGYTQTVVSGIISAAEGGAVVTYKKLTESIIVKLYEERATTKTEAKHMLVDIGYSTGSATFVLTSIDLDLSMKQRDSAITRIGNLYRTRKLDKTAAVSALRALTVTGTQSSELIKTWTLERAMTVKLLTESQIAEGLKYGVFTQTQATEELIALGYTPYDAWARLSIEMHGPLPTMPAKGPAPTGNIT